MLGGRIKIPGSKPKNQKNRKNRPGKMQEKLFGNQKTKKGFQRYLFFNANKDTKIIFLKSLTFLFAYNH